MAARPVSAEPAAPAVLGALQPGRPPLRTALSEAPSLPGEAVLCVTTSARAVCGDSTGTDLRGGAVGNHLLYRDPLALGKLPRQIA